MIGEAIRTLSESENANEIIRTAVQIKILSAELEMLKRMIIPEKHREDVVNALRQIKTDCPLNYIDMLLQDKMFLDIATPEKTNDA